MKYETAKKIKTASNLPFFLIATVMGAAFTVFSLLLSEPAEDSSGDPIIFTVIGIVLFLVGIIGLVYSIVKLVKKSAPAPKPKAPDMAQSSNADLYLDPKEKITYYVGYCGKLNQSFRMEDAEGHLWYEGTMEKFSLFGASPYIFKNYATGEAKKHMLGKVVEHEVGSITLDSQFDFDGIPVQEYLEQNGYFVNIANFNPLHLQVSLTKNGEVVCQATLKLKAKTKPEEPGVMKSPNVIIETTKEHTDFAFLLGVMIFRSGISVATI